MILVTGGTGLIGSHLLFELAQKNQRIRAIKRTKSDISNVLKVFGYYSNNPVSLFNKIEWIDADLNDKYHVHSLMEGVKDVYHSAGYISFNQRRKEELFATNIRGTANIVDAAMQKDVRKFCYVSSIATLGYEEGQTMINEKTRWKPDKKSSFYSISKFKAELEVWRGWAEGLNAVIVNPSVVLGPGFWKKGVGSMLRKIQDGFNYYTEGSTGYIDVRDVVKIMIKLMESDVTGEQFILSAENISFKQILEYFARSLGKDIQFRPASRLVASFIWRTESLRSLFMNTEPLLTHDSAKIAFEKNLYSNKKITDLLNYPFTPINESIDFIVEKFLKEENEPHYQERMEEQLIV
jgi:dihydroflavonol-4-reductase